MEEIQFDTFHQDPETLFSNPSVLRGFDWEKDEQLNQENKDSRMDEDGESLVDSMICDSGSRLIPTGFKISDCAEEVVIFVNAGDETSREADSSMNLLADTFFEGGDVLRTEECIIEGGDCPFIYHSARLGNCSYRFENLHPGDYFVDLHFVEIVNTDGPKGMRVFNVFIQEEKVLSDFDIFSIVGANKPLQLVDLRVPVKEDGLIVIRFEGVIGSPMVSGICIRKAPKLSGILQSYPFPEIQYYELEYLPRGKINLYLFGNSKTVPPASPEYLICNHCSAEIEVSPVQKKHKQTKFTAKYEKKIEELTMQCQRKTDECYEAWMSLTAANEQLEKVRMELDNRLFQKYSLDQTVEKQAEKLRHISSKYEHDKKVWATALNDLDDKIKMMKHDQSQLSREAHECADSIPELKQMVFSVQALVAQCEDFKMKYIEEQTKRKKLYNQVQDAKGNIRVFCRCRPFRKEELSVGSATVVDLDGAKDGDLGILTGGSTRKNFKFDRVYTPKDDQVDVFADASPLVISVLDGYNVCIFAYGQTGTGKTFTMEGTEQNRGVNYRTLEELFKVAEERSDTFTYSLSVSVLEVYNEQIRDLLATSPASRKLEIKQSSEGFHHVPGIVEAKVENIKEVWNVLRAGSNARAVGSNNVNEHSSRSHCMLCIMVKAKNLMNGECTKSKLWLVDLAGSERLAKTDVQGERLKEAQNINRSLSALGDVISALATKSSHVPYRNSKLTHLLQDSLGGDSKTLMFVQISPSEHDMGETLSSLNFASRVRGVELGPAKRQIDTGELQKMKTMLDKARQESRSKEESLRKLEESLQHLEGKARGKEQLNKTQQEKIKELEGQLEMKTTLHGQSEKQISQLLERVKGRDEACSSLQHKVKDLESKLKEQVQESESRSFILQQKIKELERKLKDQEQSSETSSSLQQKVNELERKLREQEQSSEVAALLHLKVKELEEKLREQEQQSECSTYLDCASVSRATPIEVKPRLKDESMSEVEPNILRNSNYMNRPVTHGSTFLRGADSQSDKRKRREFRSAEMENNTIVSNSSIDNRARQSDPPKPFARLARTVRPVGAANRPSLTHSKTSRDQVQGIKEKDTKKRIWSR